MFCESCGKILEVSKNTEGKIIGNCGCGFTKEIASDFAVSEKSKKKEKEGKGVFKEAKTIGYPNICKKCGYGECDVYEMLPSYSDESGIILYRCKKCNFVHRQHDGSSNK